MSTPIINPGSPSDKASIELATKLGNHIPNEQRKEFIPNLLLEGAKLIEPHYRIKRRSLTATYNCLGMVFGARRTWIEPENLDQILKEDGYRPLSEIYELEIGDLVVYRNKGQVSHTAVVSNIVIPLTINGKWEVEVISKWGAHGEYIHKLEVVHPDHGIPSEFWTDRKVYAKTY